MRLLVLDAALVSSRVSAAPARSSTTAEIEKVVRANIAAAYTSHTKLDRPAQPGGAAIPASPARGCGQPSPGVRLVEHVGSNRLFGVAPGSGVHQENA